MEPANVVVTFVAVLAKSKRSSYDVRQLRQFRPFCTDTSLHKVEFDRPRQSFTFRSKNSDRSSTYWWVRFGWVPNLKEGDHHG